MKIFELLESLEEGVNDPHIFKAVAMIGPMGAGKSTIAKQLVGGSGLRSLNLDNFNELITDYQTSTDTLPNVDIYYNPSENYSRDAYYNILGALEYHATEIGIERFGDSYNPFTVNILIPLVPGFFSNPANASDIEPLVVCNSVGTEIPYPSSYTITANGTCNTPAALMVSQKCPSDVLASPMVQKQTSFP